MKPKIWLALLSLLLIAAAAGVLYVQKNTAELPEILHFETETAGEPERLSCWTEDGKTWYVFLPSFAELRSLRVSLTGERTVSIGGTAYRSGDVPDTLLPDTPYPVSCGDRHGELVFLQSANVPTMFVELVSGSLAGVHETKGNSAQIRMALYDADGRLNYTGVNEELKGRGNTTWTFEKKPYNITLQSPASLLGMGSSTKWVLRANAQDETNLRNKIVHDLAAKVCRQWTPSCEYVDLYVDGAYRGLYLLMEKIELSETRFDVGKTDDFYLCNVTSPWQWDDPFRYCRVTDNGIPVEVVFPESCSDRQAENVNRTVDHFEQVLCETDCIDGIHVDSWARKYIIDELSANTDSVYASAYFYWHDDGTQAPTVYAGPVWDYDGTFGSVMQNNDPISFVASSTIRYGRAAALYYHALSEREDFMSSVREIFGTEVLPLLEKLADFGIPAYAARVEAASALNSLRWKKMYDKITTDQGAAVRTPAELREYLAVRTAFLKDAWLDGGQYHTVLLRVGDGGYELEYTVKDGKPFCAFAEADCTHYGITEPVWTYSETGETYDVTAPVTADLCLWVKSAAGNTAAPEKSAGMGWSLRNHKTEAVCIASLGCIFVFGCGLALTDFLRRRRERR